MRDELVALLVLSGCVPALPQGPAPVADTEVPERYSTAGAETPDEESGATLPWRTLFDDPQLVALVDEALANNQEMKLATQEIFLSRFEVLARRGELVPQVGAVVDAGFDRVGLHTSRGRSDEMAGLSQNLGDFGVGLAASWEVDVWGRLRNLRDASARRAMASEEGRRFLATRLVAEIAAHYYELMALDQQLQVVRDTVGLQEDALAAVELQWEAGATTVLAVRRFEAELLDYRTQRVELEQRIVETENELNFLVGRFPQPIARPSERFLAMTPVTVAPGAPSELLLHRPDLRAAELELRAAELDVAAARARYFPSLSFDAAVGYRSFDVVRLFATPASIFGNFFANLTAPLLNRREITAGYYGADARQRQAVIRYERDILRAYVEVANRLSRGRNLSAAVALREQRVALLADAIDASNQLFTSAEADYLEVLTARRESLEAQLELVETKQRQMTAAISLYQALGGGWDRPEEPEAGR